MIAHGLVNYSTRSYNFRPKHVLKKILNSLPLTVALHLLIAHKKALGTDAMLFEAFFQQDRPYVLQDHGCPNDKVRVSCV